MEPVKLRVKVGPHEFEAEGPSESVTAQFEAWKTLVAAAPPDARERQAPAPLASRIVAAATEVKTREGYAAPWDIFSVDDKKKLVTLRVQPTGDDRDANAVLLILYGYRQAFQQDDVPVTRIMESVKVSGLTAERIDRSAGPHLRAGYILKAGRGKGNRYRLTNTGFARADELARELFEKLI
jgi:hypothetical protein